MTTTKRCTVCESVKPTTEFHTNSKCRDGRIGVCRMCISDQIKARKAGLPLPCSHETRREQQAAKRGDKVCWGCYQDLPLSMFYGSRPKVLHRCSDCLRAKRHYVKLFKLDEPKRSATRRSVWIHNNISKTRHQEKQYGVRTCGRCLKSWPISDYYIHRARRDGVTSQCRHCIRDYQSQDVVKARAKRADRRRRANDPYDARRKGAIWRANNRLATRLYGRRATVGRSTARNIVKIWHHQRGECARCGAKCGARPTDGSFHLDHVLPLIRGGSDWPHNRQILCPMCNWRKHDKTEAEYTLYLKQIGEDGVSPVVRGIRGLRRRLP